MTRRRKPCSAASTSGATGRRAGGRPHLEGGVDDPPADDDRAHERRAADDTADLREGRRPLRDRRLQGRRAGRSRLVQNLSKTPEVELQVLDEMFPARARTAEGEERERLWRKAIEVWSHYDEYQRRPSARSRSSC